MMATTLNNILNPKIQVKNWMLALCALSSVLLCVSFWMSVFTAFPLILGILLFGRFKGYLIGFVGCFVTAVFSGLIQDVTFFVVYLMSMVFAIFITEIIRRNINPATGLLRLGLGFVFSVALSITGFLVLTKYDVKKFVIKEFAQTKRVEEFKKVLREKGDADSFQQLALLDQPEKFAEEVIKMAPAGFFLITFFMYWLNLMITLKIAKLILSDGVYSYTEEDLLRLKVPEMWVWFVILVFGLMLWGDEYVAVGSSEIGATLLKCSLVFYFFQGYGIFHDFLNFMGMQGVIRTMMVLCMVGFLNWMIALVGLFDVFFNFRQYLVKKEQ